MALKAKRIRVVALDLPTSWQALATSYEFTQRMAKAINGMLLDMLDAIARKDYGDRRKRQAQGIAKARAEGRMRGRQEDTKRKPAYPGPLYRARHSLQQGSRDHGVSRLQSPSWRSGQRLIACLPHEVHREQHVRYN